MTVVLLLHCPVLRKKVHVSLLFLNEASVSGHMHEGKRTYLTFKIDCRRTSQIALIIRLLHRRERLVAHHGVRSFSNLMPMRGWLRCIRKL